MNNLLKKLKILDARILRKHDIAINKVHEYVADFLDEIYSLIDSEIKKADDKTARALYGFFSPLRNQLRDLLSELISSDPSEAIRLIDKFHQRLHEEGFFL